MSSAQAPDPSSQSPSSSPIADGTEKQSMGDGIIKWAQSWAAVGQSLNRERNITEDEFGTLLLNPLLAAVCGFTVAGLASCKATANRHMEANKTTKYTSTYVAQRELNDAVLREFSRTGLRIGWRVGLFAGIFGVLSFGFEKTRGKKDVGNVVVAGALTGGVLRVPYGVGQVLFGTTLGGGISLAYGLLLQGIWYLEDEVGKVEPPPTAEATEVVIPVVSESEQLQQLQQLLKDMQQRRQDGIDPEASATLTEGLVNIERDDVLGSILKDFDERNPGVP